MLISENDKGMYDAINKGIKVAKGEIIGILNADDFYHDTSVIPDVVETMNREGASTLYSDLYYVDAIDTDKITRYWRSGEYKRDKFLFGWMPPHPTFFVRSEVYRKWGTFNLSLKSAADYELMLRFLFKYRVTTCYLNRVIVKMRVGGMSNVTMKNRLRANKEDRMAWKINNIRPLPFTLSFKPLRKIFQFIKK